MVLCGWHECSNMVPESAELGPETFCSGACRRRFVAMFDAGIVAFRAKPVQHLPLRVIAGPGRLRVT